MKRWVAVSPTTVEELLRPHGVADAALRAAIAGGRLFVGRKRVTSSTADVAAGEEVFLHAEGARRDLPEPFVLAEGAGLVAVHKPAGISTIADLRGSEGSLMDRVAAELGVPVDRLHPTSRLDREVSGVVIVATTPGSRQLAADARERGTYQRRYVAVVEGTVPERFEWTWSIGRASSARLRRAAPSHDRSALPARTIGRCLREGTLGGGARSLLALVPVTGRTHQLRVHASAAGAPMVGDVDYGAARRIVLPTGRVIGFARVALHCARVELPLDSVEGDGRLGRLVARAPIPRALVELAEAMGVGDPEEAATCDV